jgi:hypothetical protein
MNIRDTYFFQGILELAGTICLSINMDQDALQ